MPVFTRKTPKDVLRKQAEVDVARIKKTIQHDDNGLEYKWNEDLQCFENINEFGQVTLLGVDSSVPGYWFYCPKVVGSSSKGYDLKCAIPNFVFIYQDGEKLTCRKCKTDTTIKIVLPEE